MMMMNCFCGMVDRRKAFSLISIRDHCQRSSPWRIFDTPLAGFDPVQSLSSGLVEWSRSDNHYTTAPQMKYISYEIYMLWNIYPAEISSPYPTPRLILFPLTHTFMLQFGIEKNFLNVNEWQNRTCPCQVSIIPSWQSKSFR